MKKAGMFACISTGAGALTLCVLWAFSHGAWYFRMPFAFIFLWGAVDCLYTAWEIGVGRRVWRYSKGDK